MSLENPLANFSGRLLGLALGQVDFKASESKRRTTTELIIVVRPPIQPTLC